MRSEVYGTNGFHQKINQLVSLSTKLASHGGDRKSEVYKDQAGRPLDFFKVT
jgi:putative transposase